MKKVEFHNYELQEIKKLLEKEIESYDKVLEFAKKENNEGILEYTKYKIAELNQIIEKIKKSKENYEKD